LRKRPDFIRLLLRESWIKSRGLLQPGVVFSAGPALFACGVTTTVRICPSGWTAKPEREPLITTTAKAVEYALKNVREGLFRGFMSELSA
jgi:hypothetical protein